MNQSVSYVDKEINEVLFTERSGLPVPRTGEMIEYESKWYKVRQVYYNYREIGRDNICCFIEVNLVRSNFE